MPYKSCRKRDYRVGSAISTVFLLSVLALTGCATSPPAHPGDLCSIYREKRGWYHAAMRQETKWHIPSSVPMSMMYQESGFRSSVHTKRTYILWIIPWGYVSTAYGYAQAENGVWKQYQKSVDSSADRTNFSDSLNFMNWYITRSKSLNGIALTDARRQYLAYHEGWGGYRRRSYASKPSLLRIASMVGRRASTYGRQYAGCRESLKDGFWEWLWSWLF